jgi:multidrug resistance efflux pump
MTTALVGKQDGQKVMSSSALKLRKDLVVCRQDGTEGTIFVIKDPVTERYFRFKETEHFIAQQFDGATSPDTVRQRFEGKFGVNLSPENMEQFVNRLRGVGLLTNGEAAPFVPSSPRRRVAGDIFYLRFKIFDPDRLFDWLIPRIQFLFTPIFLALSAALVVCAAGVSVVNWAEIVHQSATLFRFESLALAWLVCLAVIAAHEFSHGLTCKHFGGRVREIGFLLIYFQPAFYCNVSDAWLFPEKSKRLWVTFAGAYFETFLWALATLVWRLTDPSSSLNHFALVVTVTSAIKWFFNMNPLIKLDGYYLLSDWLDAPNLRRKAFGYVGDQIKRLWGAASGRFASITPRERRIYLIYALLAGTYSYWLLGQILLWFGGFMVTRYQGWGFVLFATTLGFIFRQPIRKSLLPITARIQPWLSKGLVVPKRAKVGLGLAALLAVLFFCRLELKVSGPFTVLPLHNADVRATVEGIIEEIYADEGDFVDQGAPIARLSDRDYRAELRKTRAETEAQLAQLKLLKAGPRAEEIALARTQVAKAEERLTFSRGHLERDKLLVEQKLISEKEFEETKELVALRGKELEEARERLKVLLAGSRPEEIEALEADIRRLNAHESHLQDQLNSLNVTSPIAGVITTHKLREKIGENVKRGDLIADVNAVKSVTVEIAVPEKEIADVKIGHKVVLKARAYPRTTFEGQVMAVAPVVTKQTDWQPERTVLVTTWLDNAAGLLKPEMTGNAKIYCGEQRMLELVTRRLVRYLRVEFWSWW